MADKDTPNQNTTKGKLDQLTAQEEKILRLLREERSRVKQKFPLAYALFATFGLVAVISGFNKSIDHVPFLKENPYILIIAGITILILTGTAYRRLS